MMYNRYFLHLAYKGTKYRGWQRQKSVRSIQEVLEKFVGKILHEDTPCVGCGRTDAEVHSSQFFAHFDAKTVNREEFLFRINKTLPEDIVVYDVFQTSNFANAQRDAVRRTYDYFLHKEDNPYINDLSALYPYELDVQKMQEACQLIQDSEDFYSFCKKPALYTNTRCKIFKVNLSQQQSGDLRFTISANRFLQGMVRLLVGGLIEIGRGRKTIEDYEFWLKNQSPPKNFSYAFPQGLYLSKVEYKEIDVPTKTPIIMLNWV